MRLPSPRAKILPAFALAFALATLALQLQAPSAAAAAADSQATEVVRLINGVRATAGLSPLVIDRLLASNGRDGAIPCPDDAAATIAGRTRDFASSGAMSHYLRQCTAAGYVASTTLYVTTLQTAWGYGSVGEINLVNSGYGSGQYLYSYGGWSTWTYSTTGHAMEGWMSSSGHRNIIKGHYDRVGCGAWAAGSTVYYECAFSNGGPSPDGVRAAPTAAPFSDPLPTPSDAPATPTPVATAAAPTATCTVARGGAGGSTGGSGSASSGTATASAVESGGAGEQMLGAADASDSATAGATTGAAGGAAGGAGGGRADSGVSGYVRTSSAAAMVGGVLGLGFVFRRRSRRGRAAQA